MKKGAKKSTSKKEITTNELAAMVARGFANLEEKMATKSSLYSLEDRLGEKLTEIGAQIDQIKFNQGNRLDVAEDNIRIIKTVFEKNLKIKLPSK